MTQSLAAYLTVYLDTWNAPWSRVWLKIVFVYCLCLKFSSNESASSNRQISHCFSIVIGFYFKILHLCSLLLFTVANDRCYFVKNCNEPSNSFVGVYMHSLQQPCWLNVSRLMINILYFKIRSSTNHIASFTGFFQGLWPRSAPERSPAY